eukprot:8648972-Ditylum_brightwellii.AAC.1
MNPSTNQNEYVIATPETLLEHWWPMSVMLEFQASLNKYKKERTEEYPELYIWKKKSFSFVHPIMYLPLYCHIILHGSDEPSFEG